MRAHVIKGGKIVNTIVVESLKVLPDLIDASIGGSTGDSYANGVITPKVKPPKPAKRITLDELTSTEGVKLINFLKTNNIVTAGRAKKLKGDN